MNHGIKATVTMVSSKKWGFIKAKQSHGWKYGKTKKLSCRMRKLGRSELEISTSNTTFGNLTKFHGPGDFSEEKVGDDRNTLRGLVNFYDRKLDERISEGKVWAEGLANGDGEIRDAT